MNPKISGIVNNCALNVALPTLLLDIKHYAEIEEKGGELPTDDSVYKNHIILRKQFEKANHFKKALTWTSFQKLIETYHNNFFLLQLAFAQPLRLFIKNKGVPRVDCDLQDNGRFKNLQPHELKAFYYQPFGLNVCVFDTRAMNQMGDGSLPPDNLFCEPKESGRVELPVYSDPNLPLDATHFELVDVRDVNRQQLLQQEIDERQATPRLIADLECDAIGTSKEKTLDQFELISQDLQNKSQAQELQQLDSDSNKGDEPAPQESIDKNVAYQQYVKNLLSMFHKKVFDKVKDTSIDLDNIGDVQANEGETDEEFAARLQEAEIRRSHRKP